MNGSAVTIKRQLFSTGGFKDNLANKYIGRTAYFAVREEPQPVRLLFSQPILTASMEIEPPSNPSAGKLMESSSLR